MINKIDLKNFRPSILIASWFVFVWALLFILNFNFSRDISSYRAWFSKVDTLSSIDRFININWLHDPGYFLLQSFLSIFFTFEIFIAIVIFICLFIKLFALLSILQKISLLDVLPYFLMLSFLHEGTQIRIALALSIALWALVVFAKNQQFLACLILILASTFHISAASFFLVFLLLLLYNRFGIWIYIVLGFFSILLAYSPAVIDIILSLGDYVNARYMHYSQGQILKNQNSTGLFQYYFLFIAFLTLFILVIYQPINTMWYQLKNIATASGFLAVMFLQIFHFNVVIASRLADLLSLPVVLVMGSTLVQLMESRRYKLLISVVILLMAYGLARGYVTFSPRGIYAC